jgi:hypothetical protein
MKPRLKGVDWSCGQDWIELKDFKPQDPENFFINGEMLIGTEGETIGEDIFSFTVCSPKWFEENWKKEVDKAEFEFNANGLKVKGLMMGRHYLFMKTYDHDVLTKFLKEYLEVGCEGADWDEVAGKIGRLAYWEFEGVDFTTMWPAKEAIQYLKKKRELIQKRMEELEAELEEKNKEKTNGV